jgi:ABC-2 type transport system ATP-binding protein
MLKAENLARIDGRQKRVSGFNLDLKKGEIVGLLGINGAGKSTALALLSGALAPSSGKVEVMGIDLHRQPDAKRYIGLLPEKPALYPELTVDENLDFAARIRGMARNQVKAARENIKQRCDLVHVGKRLAGKLSKGYQQRTGIAQAMIHSPRVLALDEPTAGLDPAQADQLRSLIQAISPDCGIILASHILLDMEQLCQRVLVLNDGRLVSECSLTGESNGMIRLRLARPPELEQLSRLPGVLTAEALDADWYRLQTDTTSPELAQTIASQDWGMRAFIPESLNSRLLRDQFTNSPP